jgi:hypothetical protein
MAITSWRIAAQDLFFTMTPADNVLELVNSYKDHLGADYKIEQGPTEVRIADRAFVRLDYVSPVSKMHWHVLATQIRCHMLQFVFTGRSVGQMQRVIANVNSMVLPMQAGNPVCVKDFASAENVIAREDPVFSEPRFNAVPVRIIIDTQGKVKHIHFLSAFPDQAKSITDALAKWRFKPYAPAGSPVEVETGLMFGRAPRALTSDLR